MSAPEVKAKRVHRKTSCKATLKQVILMSRRNREQHHQYTFSFTPMTGRACQENKNLALLVERKINRLEAGIDPAQHIGILLTPSSHAESIAGIFNIIPPEWAKSRIQSRIIVPRLAPEEVCPCYRSPTNQRCHRCKKKAKSEVRNVETPLCELDDTYQCNLPTRRIYPRCILLQHSANRQFRLIRMRYVDFGRGAFARHFLVGDQKGL